MLYDKNFIKQYHTCFFKFYFIFKLYNIVLVLPNISYLFMTLCFKYILNCFFNVFHVCKVCMHESNKQRGNVLKTHAKYARNDGYNFWVNYP